MHSNIRGKSVVAIMAIVSIAILFISGRATTPVYGATADHDDAALAAMVRDEVARQIKAQLPELVKAEVKSQIDELRHQSALQSRAPAARSMIQTIRSQIMLYKLQHRDIAPTFEQLSSWEALTHTTDTMGRIDSQNTTMAFGPYLPATPHNPLNNSSTVVLRGHATPGDGFVYDPESGNIWLVVPPAFRNQITENEGLSPDDNSSTSNTQ